MKFFKLIFPKSSSWPETMDAVHWRKLAWANPLGLVAILLVAKSNFAILILWSTSEQLLT